MRAKDEAIREKKEDVGPFKDEAVNEKR